MRVNFNSRTDYLLNKHLYVLVLSDIKLLLFMQANFPFLVLNILRARVRGNLSLNQEPVSSFADEAAPSLEVTDSGSCKHETDFNAEDKY